MTLHQLHGIELGVGKKPPILSPNQLLDFNEIYLTMFNAFATKPRISLTYNNTESWDGQSVHLDDGGLNKFGMLSVSRIRKNLEYFQLIKSHKEQSERKPKTRTILEPTKLGYEVLEQGRLFEMQILWENSTANVGLGKPYPTFNEMWNKIEKMFLVAQIAKTRREKWFFEFREYYRKHLLSKQRPAAEADAVEFARTHIASAPRRRFARALKIKVEIDLSQRLEKWFQPANHSFSSSQ